MIIIATNRNKIALFFHSDDCRKAIRRKVGFYSGIRGGILFFIDCNGQRQGIPICRIYKIVIEGRG